MAIIMGDLRAALVDAGASEELAMKAASEVATYEGRLASIDMRLSVLSWMVTFALGLIVLLVAGEIGIWQKLGEMNGTLAQLAQHVK